MFNRSLRFFGTATRLFSSKMSKQVALIGSGPASLYAAICLQNKGYDVSVFERKATIGGPCGSISYAGKQFELSNQPGAGAVKLLAQEGVSLSTNKVTNELLFNDGTLLKTPLDLMSIWNLCYPGSIRRVAQSAWRKEYDRLLLDLAVDLHPKFGMMLLAMFGYPASNPNVNIGQLLYSAKDAGGYTKPVIPVGGMPGMIDAMAKHIGDGGGKIYCNQECLDIVKQSSGTQLVKTADKNHQASLVLSAVHAYDHYPENSLPGLPVTTMFLEMDKTFEYPEGVHTLAFLPETIDTWFHQLNDATIIDAFPQEFGFHCFKNQLLDAGNNITAFIPAPRSMADINEEDRDRIVKYVLDKIGGRIPNFAKHVERAHLLSSNEFMREFDMSSRVPPLVLPDKYNLPVQDANSGAYLIGSATYPTSPNIFGAMNSVRELIDKVLFQQIPASVEEVATSTKFMKQ